VGVGRARLGLPLPPTQFSASCTILSVIRSLFQDVQFGLNACNECRIALNGTLVLSRIRDKNTKGPT
jgi:hypothetical protein